MWGGDDNCWIGYDDIAQEGTWVWVYDGESSSFTNWHDREPNSYDGEEDCANIWSDRDGKWLDWGCSNNSKYVCEARPSIITTIAGTGTRSYSGDGGAATSATIITPDGIVIDSSRNVYFNDNGNHRVRKITASTGMISTYAGTGTSGYSGDGAVASSAALNYPHGLCIDTSGNLYIGEYNHRIRKITASTSVISTIAGTGTNSYSGDNGSATSAELSVPTGVAVDSSGNIYISDSNNNRVRKVTSSTSVITTIAGTGSAGYGGDGGQATAATISLPHGVNLDSAGNVYFGDHAGYNVIRKITVSTGIISTVAGAGSASGGYNGDNIQATAATLHGPHDVVLDSYDNLYISDLRNNRIRKVTASTGVITTVVGTGTASSTGDGSAAISATIDTPSYSRFDSEGNLYISSYYGNRIRQVKNLSDASPTSSPILSPTSSPTSLPSVTPTYNVDLSSTVQVYLNIHGWPSGQVDASQEAIFKHVIVRGADARAPFVSLSYTFTASSGRKLFINNFRALISSLWVLTATASITTTSPQTTKAAFISYMATSFNVTALIEQLNTACSCSSYSSITVTYGVYEPRMYYHVSDYVPALSRYIIAIVIPIVILCAICWMYLAIHHKQMPVSTMSFLLISILGTCDHLSDLHYLLLCKYDNHPLLLASAIFVMLSNIHFFVIIHDSHACPSPLFDYYIGKQIQLNSCPNLFWVWLSQEQGVPLVNHTRLWFTFSHHDSLPKLIIYVVSWVLLLVLQAVSLLPFVFWLVLVSPIYIAIILLGCFFYQTNLLASTVFWNAWFSLYSGRVSMFDKYRSMNYDTQLLNDSMVVHLFLSSIPQVIVKIYNNSLIATEDMTAAYWLSVVMSLVYIVIGLYRYMYRVFVEKTSLSKVSFMSNCAVQIGGESALVGIPRGAHDVRKNKEVRDHDMNKWRELLCHYEVEEVLKLSENLISRCFFNEEQFMRISSVIGGNETDEKSMNKVHEELSNVMRQCQVRHMSAHDLASRVFSLIIRDTVDNKLYTYLKLHGILDAHNLINCNPSIVDTIVNSINNYTTKKLVAVYLKLIALNRTVGIRNSITTFVESMVLPATITNDPAELYRYSSYTSDIQSQSSITLSYRTIDAAGSDKYEVSSEVNNSNDDHHNAVYLEDGKVISGTGDSVHSSNKSSGGGFTWRTIASSKTASNTGNDITNGRSNNPAAIGVVAAETTSSKKSDSIISRAIWRAVSSQKLQIEDNKY